MKMIIISYNEGVNEEVMEAVKACGEDCFTQWQRVLGKGVLSEPHFLTPVWPGVNNVLMVVTEEAKAKMILIKIGELRETLGKEGIKAFMLPVDAVV